MRARDVLAVALLLAACDRATIISHVDRRGDFGADDLWTIQGPRGIPVEVHGAPFPHVTDREIVAALRPPGGSAQEVAFYTTPPGSWVHGRAWRLVLHFNPIGAPNSVKDCERVAEARTEPPTGGGFTLNATFCNGPDWAAQGYLQAPAIDDGDFEAFSDMIAQLMLAIFHEEKDR